MNILLAEYGDYSNLPVVISGNILDVNMKQITPNIKSNFYLWKMEELHLKKLKKFMFVK